jgi:anaerobic selenocysteine-containing dehydrogenase
MIGGEIQMREVVSFCRICGPQCGTMVRVDDAGQIEQVRGDKDHVLTAGFACGKGVEAAGMYRRSDRITRPLKRMPDGAFAEISLDQASQEIAEALQKISDRDGPEAISLYSGTAGAFNSTAAKITPAFMEAISSPSRFTSLTIDCSSAVVCVARMGMWTAGKPRFENSDVWLMFGSNPLVSMTGQSGVNAFGALKKIKEAKARGMKLIVIDPRRTETAMHADVFLQVRPGEDAALAAGLLRIILDEGLYDKDFTDAYVDGLDRLRAAVDPFTPDYVAKRVDVSVALIYEAARTFGGAGLQGCAYGATGITMAPYSNLIHHLIEALNVVCGRFLRAGDKVANPLALGPAKEVYAEVARPPRWWENGHKLRSGYGMIYTEDGGELPTTMLADEILSPGKGQIKALFCVGGNPASAFPNQVKAVEAMEALELLVAVEPFMTTTARLAHYIIPPKLMYERADIPLSFGASSRYPAPFTQYAAPVVDAPEGSELTEEWHFFWDVARRMGRPIKINGEALPMDRSLTTDEFLDAMTRDSRVPLDDVRRHPRGAIYPVDQYIQPARAEATARFELLPDDVAEELQAFANNPADDPSFPYLMTNRRVRNAMNSLIPGYEKLGDDRKYNPAYLNSADLAQLGVERGDTVEIASPGGRLRALVEVDDALRPGVVAMTHSWGGLPGDPDAATHGAACTSLLVSTDREMESINAMPRMTAIPVRIERLHIGPE